MISPHLIALIALLAILIFGIVRPVNLGAIALMGAFAVGTLAAGEDVRAIYSGFPADIFVLILGVTYLFGIASVNGTIEWLVNACVRLIGGNAAWIPWAIFFVSAVPAVAGAAGPAAVAMLTPICLRLSSRYGITPRLAGLMVAHGAAAGNFSPLNPLGAIVNGTVTRSGLTADPAALFLANFFYNVALGVVIYVTFGGLGLLRRAPAPEPAPIITAPEAPPRMNAVRGVTLLCIILAATGALVFRLDLGLLAVSAAVLLHLLFPSTSKGAMDKVSWSTVLLMCGMVTYMALLQRMGTIALVGESVAGVATPLLGALLIAVIAAVTSAFASTTGVLVVLIPLAVPLLQTGALGVTDVVIALAISATVVDSSPFSSVGALVVANAPKQEQDQMFRDLFAWGMAMMVSAPVATWLFFVLPG